MALNPPLLPGLMPVGIAGELFCVRRDGVHLEVSGPGCPKIKSKGVIYLSTVRICFVPSAPGADGFVGIDLPLQGITGEEFCQPIFGANYLKGVIAPVPGRGLAAPVPFKLHFYHGGCATFLRYFFGIMEKYRAMDAAARAAFVSSARSVQSFIVEQQAYMDPTDPTVVYVAQPEYAATRDALPASSVPYAPPPPLPSPSLGYGYAPSPVGVPTPGYGPGYGTPMTAYGPPMPPPPPPPAPPVAAYAPPPGPTGYPGTLGVPPPGYAPSLPPGVAAYGAPPGYGGMPGAGRAHASTYMGTAHTASQAAAMMPRI